MKYATEVIDLLARAPGRKFRMREIVRHLKMRKGFVEYDTRTVTRGVARALIAMADESKVVEIIPPSTYGAPALYVWRDARAGEDPKCAASFL